MSGRIILTSFYGDDFGDDPHWSTRQGRLHDSALAHGDVDGVLPWNGKKLGETLFARENREILDQPRGYGNWLWKPYIILQGLAKIDPGDYLVYHDVGRPRRGDPTRGYTIEYSTRPLTRWADAHGGLYPGVYMPHHGSNSSWTKRDCFIRMDCDSTKYWQSPQIQAGYNVWKNTPTTREFVEQWLAYCRDPAILTDQENIMGKPDIAGFREHRYDQSVLTNLCIKRDVAAYGDPRRPILLHRDFNSLIRHARFDELVAEGKNRLREIIRSNPAKAGEPPFDRSRIRWLELYFCERRHDSLGVLLVGEEADTVWRQYLPRANIERQAVESRETHRPDTFDLIVIRDRGSPAEQHRLVSTLFPSIRPGGMLICGQVEKSWDKGAVEPSSLGLVRDFWKHKEIRDPSVAGALRDTLNQHLQMAFTAWDQSGQRGNVYFLRHES